MMAPSTPEDNDGIDMPLYHNIAQKSFPSRHWTVEANYCAATIEMIVAAIEVDLEDLPSARLQVRPKPGKEGTIRPLQEQDALICEQLGNRRYARPCHTRGGHSATGLRWRVHARPHAGHGFDKGQHLLPCLLRHQHAVSGSRLETDVRLVAQYRSSGCISRLSTPGCGASALQACRSATTCSGGAKPAEGFLETYLGY